MAKTKEHLSEFTEVRVYVMGSSSSVIKMLDF